MYWEAKRLFINNLIDSFCVCSLHINKSHSHIPAFIWYVYKFILVCAHACLYIEIHVEGSLTSISVFNYNASWNQCGRQWKNLRLTNKSMNVFCFEDLDLDGRILLKCVLQKHDGRAWTGPVRLRILRRGGLFKNGNGPSGFLKFLEHNQPD
jgi:hypothetical protein